MELQRKYLPRALSRSRLFLLSAILFSCFSYWQYTQHLILSNKVSFLMHQMQIPSTEFTYPAAITTNEATPPVRLLAVRCKHDLRWQEIPHVDSCGTCDSCQTTPSTTTRLSRLLLSSQRRQIRLGQHYNRRGYKNCTECWGCRHTLTRLPKKKTAFNLSEAFDVERGQTAAHIYQINDPTNHTDEQFVVKLWGINLKNKPLRQKKRRQQKTSIQLALSIQKLVDECGFRDIVANVWLAPVDSVIPRYGIRVKWDGLWSELAKGVAALSFDDHALDEGMDPEHFSDFLNNKLNSSQIVRAAIFDLLISQIDRHSGNVFIDENGQITLIDNDEVLGYGWRSASLDSLFLPSTQYHSMQHVGQDYLRKKQDQPRAHLNSPVVFDYRCHIEGGLIGFNYPPQVRQTMERLRQMSLDEIKDYYGLPAMRTAEKLKVRAVDMLEKGFEWTLENGYPQNPSPLRYPWHPPCCKIRVNLESRDPECVDVNYHRDFFRPEGDSEYPEEEGEESDDDDGDDDDGDDDDDDEKE